MEYFYVVIVVAKVSVSAIERLLGKPQRLSLSILVCLSICGALNRMPKDTISGQALVNFQIFIIAAIER